MFLKEREFSQIISRKKFQFIINEEKMGKFNFYVLFGYTHNGNFPVATGI